MSADTTELAGLERSFRGIPVMMVPKMRGVVEKSANNTKKIMRADVRKSRHFRGKKKPGLESSITYSMKTSQFFGDAVIQGEVGPSRGSGGFGGDGGGGSGSGGSAASLAGIAYYGTSRPGGGTVRNPEDAMLEEAPNFYEYAFKATEGLL